MIPTVPRSPGSRSPDSGLYILLLELEVSTALRIGALGTFTLPAGRYLYTGSARRGLKARVARHLSPEKTPRWHIDYLTTAPRTSPIGAVAFPVTLTVTLSVALSGGDGKGTLSECELNRRAGVLAGGMAPVPGFGASDCRAGCAAHLWYTGRRLSLHHLAGLEAARCPTFRIAPPRRQIPGPGHHG